MLTPNKSFSLREGGYSTSEHSAELSRHRWYHIKEAFSPVLLDRVLEMGPRSGGRAVIIDPFCGSGTVPLFASLRDMEGIGIEVNPFLAFVSRTKLLQPEPQSFRSTANRAIAAVKKEMPSPLEGYSTFGRRKGLTKWLFNRSVLRSFEGGWHAMSRAEQASGDLVRLALLASAMASCNAKRDGKCLRYYPDWESRNYGKAHFLDMFERQ